ncbi:ABC transporter substrate-binding protein [Kineosporia succinea]|uniref:Multiple sugar transport system substrate-binding protein n=1 Tax=Kineosporia succinea TaxID=84632 RepID=A0ABT9PB29_9ACTN|nr:sugar ABC transporter substrate-binding protein [Kineosporia succinea]MDP9829909.1 multiple sugar transport system substrate-binding protein [Kineosporia succinea]
MTTPFSRRTLLGGAFAGLSTLALAGCAVGGDDADVALSNEEVTLRFTWWGSDARHELTQKAIDAFQKENPKIKVKGEFADWQGYWDRLATTFAANDSADIIQMDELYLRTYADRGSLMDLAKTKEFLDLSGFEDVTLQAGQAGGTQYALPIGNGAMSLVANKTLFEKYGIALPDDKTWTWDEFESLAAEFSTKSKGDVVGVGALGTEAGQITNYARQNGGDLFDDSGNVVLEAAVLAEFWERTARMAGKGAPSAESSVEQMTAALNQTWLVLGKQAMNFNYNTQIISLQAATKDAELVLLELPTVDSAKPGFYYKPSMYWSIAARTKHPAEAAKFVDFLANSPEAAKIIGVDRGIPANSKALQTLRPELDAPSEQAAAFNDLVSSRVSTPPALTPAGASDINNLTGRYVQEVLFDRQKPAEAAQKYIDELKTAVENAK